MSNELVSAAERLGEMLQAENAALAVFDFVGATSMLTEKAKAIDAFVALQALARAGMPMDISAEDALALSAHLTALAEENKRLLAQALQIQKRVIRVIADAIPPPEIEHGARYSSGGNLARGGNSPAYALIARI
jgi:hypothetical protein